MSSKTHSKTVILAGYIVAILIVTIVLSWVSYRFFHDSKVNQLALTESEVLSSSASLFNREIGHIKRMTQLLRNSVNARLGGYTHTLPSVPTGSFETNTPALFKARWDEQIVDEFRHFAQTSSLISQVRWIMPDGQERIRINSQAGKVTRVGDDQLQNKADRPYVENAPDNMDDVYISSLDLNIENKEIVRPLQPTVRGVIRMNEPYLGMLVVNYDLTKLFDLVRAYNTDDVYLEIVDAQGNWVMAADRRLEWSSILHPEDGSFTLASYYPAIWEAIENANGVERVFDGVRLWSVLTLNMGEDTTVHHAQMPILHFVARSNAEAFSKWRMKLLLVIFFISLLAFSLLTWLVWRQINTQFETYRLLSLVQREKDQADRVNRQLSVTNKRLVDLQDELVETSKLSSLGLMVAGLAHEMHTPLGGVRMALSSCQMWLERVAQQESSEALEKMDSSLRIAEKNLSRALDVISSFKRIVSDRTAQEMQAFCFHNVVNDIVFTYKPILKKHPDIRLDVVCPEDINMLGYPGVLSQIIQNLIDNALTHGFQRLDKGVITLNAQKEQEKLILVIKDNGRGMSPEIKHRIFDPFVTSGRAQHHTGLGMHLVSQWVNKLMQGRIEVTSELGVGTTFRLEIPLIQQKAENERETL